MSSQPAWALLLVGGLLLSACTDNRAPQPPPSTAGTEDSGPNRTLRVAVDEPDSLLPSIADEPSELWLADALFDGLTRWDDNFHAQPAAAVSWRSNNDFTKWTFTLREGATWHNGEAVVAGDFVRGWRRVAQERRMAHLLFAVEGVTESDDGENSPLPAVHAVDPLTFAVELKYPDADFPLTAAHPALAPLQSRTERSADIAQAVGNGPFAMAEEQVRGKFVRVRRNEQWRNGRLAELDEIVFQVMDPETAFLAFQQGRIHVAPVPTGALRRAVASEGQSIWRTERAALYLLGMDHRYAPFDRVAVRRALSLAIDRDALAAQVAEGSTSAVTELLPSWLPEHSAMPCAVCRRDLQTAREAFRAAGVTTLRLSFNAGAGHETVARRIRADLAQVGVSLQLDALESSSFFSSLRSGGLALYRQSWQQDVPTADALLTPLLSRDAVPTGPDDIAGLRHNFARYRAADMDTLLQQARATGSAPVRAALRRRAARMAFERDVAVVPLFVYRHRLAISGLARGIKPDALGLIDWAAAALRDV